MNELIGCCGLDCENCSARIATVTNSSALREETAALWTRLNGVTITPEMINCTGCRAKGAKTPFCDRLCPVHNCVREKRLDTCADCPQLDGCPTLGRIAANSPFVLENLKRLRGAGNMSNSSFVIERARPEDAAELLDYLKIVGGETDNLSFGAEGVALSLEAEQEYLHAQYGSTDNAQYLARAGSEIIGTASLNRKANRMSHRGVFGISLKKAWWGCGAASALTEVILAFAKENGFEQLNLEVRSSNARAIRLYEKYGFRKLCTFPHFFKIGGEYVDFDLMNLELGEAK